MFLLNELYFDTIVAFITFGSLRYLLPNYILNRPLSIWAGFVLSFCYALCAYVRKYMNKLYKEKFDKKK